MKFYEESIDLVENDEDKDFNDNKLIILDSDLVDRNPS